MNSLFYIVNPVAGKGRGKKTISEIKRFHKDSNVKYKIVTTKFPKHATEIAQNISGKGDLIISVGGDGTLNEIVKGLNLKAKNNLAVLPIGSGNDFASNFNYCKSVKENLTKIVKNKSNLIPVDIGAIEFNDKDDNQKQTVFINSLGIGFDAYVAYLNQNNKTLSGISSYIVAVFKALTKLTNVKMNIRLAEMNLNGAKLLLAIGNGKTSGGGFYLNPNAKIHDGFLDLTIIDKINSRFKLIRKLPLALFNKIETIPEISMYKFKMLEIDLERPYYVHTDGEIISKSVTNLKVETISSAVNFVSLS